MPLFVINAYDVANSTALRAQIRPQHIARLQALAQAGRLVLAGPTPTAHGACDMTGSVIIANFDDEVAVQAWLDDEPYLHHGVYSRVEVRPFVQVLPCV